MIPVADHDEQLTGLVSENLLEDRPLLRIRILGFVDQAGLVGAADKASQFLSSLGIFQRFKEVSDHRVMGQVGPGELHLGDPVLDELLQPRTLQSLVHRELLAADDPFGRIFDFAELQGSIIPLSAKSTPEVFGDLQGDLFSAFRFAVDGREAGRGAEIGVGAMAEGVDRRDLHLRQLLERFRGSILFQQLTHALAHLHRGCIRKSDQEGLGDVPLLARFVSRRHLRDPFDDADEVVGLAGTRAGFDHAEPLFEVHLFDIKFRRHGFLLVAEVLFDHAVPIV